MYQINEDLSIYVTRGDAVLLNVKANDKAGKPYTFLPGDIVHFTVYKKKKATDVVLDKRFTVETATQEVQVYLSGSDTKIGEVISKPTTYWYEVVLNEDTEPQTIIGYDQEEGAKLFILLPEGADKEDALGYEPDEDERYMDYAALVREMAQLTYSQEQTHKAVAELHVTPEMYGAIGDGVSDDTEAFEKAIADGKTLSLDRNYKVSAITLPKRVVGHGKIEGEVTIAEEGSYIDGVTFKGKINFNARNSRVVNCDFNECAFYLNKWANSFISCYFNKSPIFFEIELSATNNFVNCYFSSTNQFLGTPSNLHITGGWIEECTNVFNLGETSNVFGVIIENCDIESCKNLINLRGNVMITHLVFSKCVILGNKITTCVLNTDESSSVTNDVSVKFDDCFIENLKDFTSIKDTNCGIQGLPKPMYTKNVPYDNAANVSWTVRNPLHKEDVPDFEIEEVSSNTYKVMFREPVFIGAVTCSQANKITANRCVNGAFVTTERTGTTATFNSTCYSLIISASAKPTISLTTSGDIY